MLGIEAFLEILAAANVRYIFGNPGTTGLPLNDALVKDESERDWNDRTTSRAGSGTADS